MAETAWHQAFPQPRNQHPDSITREELLTQLHSGPKSDSKVMLVDLRRNDHEGGAIRGSLNLPAQTLYPSLPTLLELCRGAGIQTVVWYCGSSRGRGTRAAGWFDDLLQEQRVSGMRSVILEGGITGWANAGDEYTRLMEGYDAGYWEKKEAAALLASTGNE